jgi:signal transduction histidine kinase
LRQAQEQLGFSLLDARLAITPHGLCERALSEEQPLFFEDSAELIVESFPELPHPLAELMITLVGPGQAICAPLPVGGGLHGLLMVFGSDLQEADLMAVTAFANQATIAVENAWLLQTATKHKEDLQRLSKQLLDAQEAERKRISRELHDELGQALTVIGMNLEELEKAFPSEGSPQLKERLAETTRLADETLEQVREMALGLRPSLLDDLGLVPALRWYCNRLTQRRTIEINFEAVDCKDRLPIEVETALYRIVQEALTNITRHARASRVHVRLECRESTIVTTIEDDGQGFDPETVASRGGVGLLGIRERAALLGGSLSIKSQPGQGTRLTLHIPWGERA